MDASNQVHAENPTLHAVYVRDSRYPHLRGQPVTKQAAPVLTPEAVIQAARVRAATDATSCRVALLKMLTEHEGTAEGGVVVEAWRRYHTSNEGRDAWYQERLDAGTTS